MRHRAHQLERLTVGAALWQHLSYIFQLHLTHHTPGLRTTSATTYLCHHQLRRAQCGAVLWQYFGVQYGRLVLELLSASKIQGVGLKARFRVLGNKQGLGVWGSELWLMVASTGW